MLALLGGSGRKLAQAVASIIRVGARLTHLLPLYSLNHQFGPKIEIFEIGKTARYIVGRPVLLFTTRRCEIRIYLSVASKTVPVNEKVTKR